MHILSDTRELPTILEGSPDINLVPLHLYFPKPGQVKLSFSLHWPVLVSESLSQKERLLFPSEHIS